VSKASKNKGLETALATIEKNFGSGATRLGSELEKVNFFRTGHDDLDAGLVEGGGGFARGKIIELYGPEKSGKSSLALRCCSYAQKEGYTPYWIDLERALVRGGIAEINGVDMDKMWIPKLEDMNLDDEESGAPFDAGKVLDLMLMVIKTAQFNPVVLDSVAGLVSENEMNAESFNKNQMMDTARLISKAVKKINAFSAMNDICVIFVNQERDKPDVQTGHTQLVTPGGKAIKYYASQRIRVWKKSGSEALIYTTREDGVKDLIGHWAKAKIDKNRCAPPLEEPVEIPIYYKHHFPDEAERLYQLARDLQVISKRGEDLTWKYGKEVILRNSSPSEVMELIRSRKLEPRLSFECIAAAAGEKNQKKKSPVVIPASLAEIAKGYDPKTNEKGTEEETDDDEEEL